MIGLLLTLLAPVFAQAAAPAVAPAKAPPFAQCLLEAYPGALQAATAEHLIWADGTRMRWRGVKTTKMTYRDLLDMADLTDQFSQPYPIGAAWTVPPAQNVDPGRLRSEAFFRKMYGNSANAVARTIKRARWMPKSSNKKMRVTTVNDVHLKLEAVGRELDKLPKKIRKYAQTPAGVFVWRQIKGTQRLSMHSFAIAVDVGVKYSDYWRWNKPAADGSYPYKNRFPMEIVEVFEKHGFIWGGKWAHYDTMHFEYRPELLHPACVKRASRPSAAPKAAK
ncbi:MAG: peptidoglycan L-alanyl-D-glutamate endopeptidase CwlK [Bradymonadia bacterium]|jgi:peptidoglycan L-alanyl-D-glutamate endopeptidase CwlK